MVFKRQDALSYASFSISLGFIGLPLYVYLPKYYADAFGLSLLALSLILFLSRIIDTVQDPLIGWLSDRLVHKKISRFTIIVCCLPFLALGFLGLLFPPDWGSRYGWIGLFLIATYTFYSFISINYNTTATEMTEDYHQQTQLVSTREAFALIGIAAGSIIPSTLLNQYSADTAHWLTWLIYIGLSIVGISVLLRNKLKIHHQKSSTENMGDALKTVIKNAAYVKLVYVFFLSTIAASIPATVVLFYIQDVLQGAQYFGLFLFIYFICALIGLPIWYQLSKHKGKKKTWIISMIVTIIGFIWAVFLSPGDFIAYGIICALTGFCVGADLSIPASMLSDLIAKSSNKAKYFGVWGMVSKSSIAVAGSLSLFILSVLGYKPHLDIDDTMRLYVAITYALIPCMIKIISVIILIRSKIDIHSTKTTFEAAQ